MRSAVFSSLAAILLVLSCSLSEAIEDDSLVLYMPFEEGSGDATQDLSGKGNHGTLMNGVEWIADGKVGKALSFDGTDDYVSIGAQLNSLDKPKTYEMWIRPSVLDRAGLGLFSIHKDGDNRWYIDLTGSAGDEIRIFGKIGGQEISQIRTVPIIQIDAWQHVAVVEDADNDTYLFYVNGELLTLTNDSGGPINFSDMPADCEAVVGARFSPDGLIYFGGAIDEVAVYAKALTQAEVQADMNDGIMEPSSVRYEDKLATTWADMKAY